MSLLSALLRSAPSPVEPFHGCCEVLWMPVPPLPVGQVRVSAKDGKVQVSSEMPDVPVPAEIFALRFQHALDAARFQQFMNQRGYQLFAEWLRDQKLACET